MFSDPSSSLLGLIHPVSLVLTVFHGTFNFVADHLVLLVTTFNGYFNRCNFIRRVLKVMDPCNFTSRLVVLWSVCKI